MNSPPRHADAEAARFAAEAAEDAEEAAHLAVDAGDLKAAFDAFRVGAALVARGCMLDLGSFHDEGLGTLRSKHQAMHGYRQPFASSRMPGQCRTRPGRQRRAAVGCGAQRAGRPARTALTNSAFASV